MFSIDFPELIIIFGVALVVLGPKKLPGAAAKVGRWVGRARTMARQFREQLEQEVSTAEKAADIRESVDSVGQRAPPQAPKQTAPAARPESTPPEAAPRESAPAAAAQAAGQDAPVPQHPMPPPEGYEQLSFDAQLHNTALPPEGGLSGTGPQPARSAAPEPDAHGSDVRDWMPETQTWMASAGWEHPEPAKTESAGPRSGPEPAEPAAQSSPSATHASERAK